MSKVRDKAIAEWSKGNAHDGDWVDSDEPVTLNKDHQRIDYIPKFSEYKRGQRGFWCSECGAKCTVGHNREEYGHYGRCPHRNVERDTWR